MKVIIAPDSFKGCLTSAEACQAIVAGVFDQYPDAIVHSLPLSDGGEGLTEVLTHALNGHLVSVNVHGPLMEPIQATYGIIPSEDENHSDTAIIEMAAACGLPLVPVEQRNPELTTTYGFGEMILDALHRGCKRLILGIGGSATNDAGLGMLQALGAIIHFAPSNGPLSNHRSIELTEPQNPLISSNPSNFLNSSNFSNLSNTSTPLTGSSLSLISNIDASPLQYIFNNVEILVACDVQNPLSGPQGAAYVFAPQKGADAEAVKRLDDGLKHILDITHTATLPGDGAAGGLGFALRHFLHATMLPGIELVLSQLHFDAFLPDADLIITGEGKSDAQTLMGKVPMGVLNHAQWFGKPVHLIAGKIEDAPLLLSNGFAGVHCINEGDPAPLQELITPEHASQNIRKTVSKLLSQNIG